MHAFESEILFQGGSTIGVCSTVSEGALDYKYLNDRYVKGKNEVEKFMQNRHRFTRHPSIVLGHSSIVSMQADLGPNGLLDQHMVFGGARQPYTTSVRSSVHLRVTILVLDTTLWPTSVWASTIQPS